MKLQRSLSLLFSTLLLSFCLESEAQRQLHLTQYNLHQPYLNPASISSYSDMSASLLYKKQWVGFDGSPTFQGIDFNMPIGESPSSIGLTAFNDALGITRTTDIGLNYAYRLKVRDEGHLSFGLSGKLLLRQSDHTELRLQDEQDPSFAEDSPNAALPDFRFGAYYFQEKYYVGLAMPNLLNGQWIQENGGLTSATEFDPSAIHYYLHGGYEFELDPDWKFQPSTMFKFIGGAPLQMDLSAQFLYEDLYGIGFGYRSKEIMNVFFNLRFMDQFRVGYAYDFNLSDISVDGEGSHEVMLIYERRSKDKDRLKGGSPRF